MQRPTRMKKTLGVVGLIAVALAAIAFLWSFGIDALTERAFATSTPLPPAASKALPPGDRVTFLELGSVGCRPCEAMKPVMQAVRDRYGKQVEVTFHDVKRDPATARKWRVTLIPTQIFLDPGGQEVFRHEGFFALDDVEKVLRQMGVK